LSDGINEMHRREEIERDKKYKSLEVKFTKILDDYKWLIAKDFVDAIRTSPEEEE